jgi:DNA-binding NarL/FixJ family response regulator
MLMQTFDPQPIASRSTDEIIETLLTDLSRFRALSDQESELLERVILRNGVVRVHRWYWLPADDRRLKQMAAKGMTAQMIAAAMNRTPEAVRTRIKKLKKQPQKAQVRARLGRGRHGA